MAAAGLAFHDRTYDGATVVTPTGRLDITTCHLMRDHLLKVATDSPRAVIVDLGDLSIGSPAPLAVFVNVHSRLAEWPDVPLLLVPGNPQVADTLTRGRISRFVPVRPDVRAAVDAIGHPPPRRVTATRLTNRLASPRAARAFTRHTCAEWDVREISEDAVLVVSELVANTVVHTSSDPRLRLELRRGVFSVAVYDDEPGEVVVRDPGPGLAGLHGLLLVAQVATAWGWSPTPHGGKVVWATLGTSRRVRC
jgi:anti-anti-sigma factor